jgi:hypothetical protein
MISSIAPLAQIHRGSPELSCLGVGAVQCVLEQEQPLRHAGERERERENLLLDDKITLAVGALHLMAHSNKLKNS